MIKVNYIIGFFLETQIVTHYIPAILLRNNNMYIRSYKKFRNRQVEIRNKSFDRNSNKL